MKIAFFVSSVGDTDLAKATITKLIEQSSDSILIIPLTTTAVDRTKDLKDPLISVVSIEEITKQTGLLTKDQISEQEAEAVKLFLQENHIEHVYFGVPSNNNEIPYQIATRLTIPFTVAYEYMFKPEKHSLWKHVGQLASKENGHFAVPLDSAVIDIKELNGDADVQVVGHLSLDRVQGVSSDIAKTRKTLSVDAEQELVFVSGTTQPTEVDNQFLNALLTELSTGKYPAIQLRMGIHPGVKDLDAYLQTLLKTCEMFPATNDQFKIVINSQIASKLKQPLADSPFIIRADVSGPDAAQAADKITQAVPGALLNEAALKGKPSYFHDKSAKPYLPKSWFSENISAFFTAKPESPHTKSELGLKDTAPSMLSKLMTK